MTRTERAQHPHFVVIAGPTASGKSTIGAALAARLQVPFIDGDDLHSDANRSKMSSGTPLSDEDRGPWLTTVGRTLASHASGGGCVVACSALARRYRDAIRAEVPGVWFGVLEADAAELTRRSSERADHFMPPALVASQIALLEPLEDDEAGEMINTAGKTIQEIVDHALTRLP
ncbi:gluconokinase [Demequina flava]|uniref:gluconokinase n=1 Tax=Demequina flava TaxID=1095025 RepID=UPI00078308FD|nr:gluconokinase, GntK/IdnK-type [Demequina flava]